MIGLPGLMSMLLAAAGIVFLLPRRTLAANPFLPLWERIPDGEPRVYVDPETGQKRLYVYGSHDSRTTKGYCGPDHVVWSAPLGNLTNWRHEGTAFHINRLQGVEYVDRDGLTKKLTVDAEKTALWAPDVVYHPENKKYYMYLFVAEMWNVNPDPIDGSSRIRHPMFVASSDHPAGPFEDPKFVYFAFDPAVLVDDVKNEQGKSRVYLYFTPQESRNLYACELDPDDMATIIPGSMHCPFTRTDQAPQNTMPDWTPPFHVFEGASIRKVRGVYLLAYCRAVRTNQTAREGFSQIGWAYSDNPFGDPALGSRWTYGGVVVDNRGEIVVDPYTGELTFSYTGGNDHGGMVDVDGRWYQVYHRATNFGLKRQAMAEAFDLRFENGKPVIDQVEVTSQGFETEGLDPFKEHYAACACFTLPVGPEMGPRFFTQHSDEAPNFDPEAEREDWYPVLNLCSRSWLGYKYFNFGAGLAAGQTLKLVLTLKESLPGRVNIYTSEAKAKYAEPEKPKRLMGSIELEGTNSELHTVEGIVETAGLTGKQGIYLEFLSEIEDREICQLNKLQFVVGSEDFC